MSCHVIVRPAPTAPLSLAPCRRRHRLLARLLAEWLDPRLAAGIAPETGRLLAARAVRLVDPRERESLADAWDGVLERAARPRGVLDSRVSVAPSVVDAAAEIAALTAALRSTTPPAARDVARARALVTDGASPVYSGASGLRTTIAQLVVDLETPQVAERSLTACSWSR